MFQVIKELIYAKAKAFWTFFVGGGVSVGSFLFLNVSPEHTFLVQYVAKAAGTILVAFCTGVAGAVGRNWMDNRKKKKEAKRFVDGHKNVWKKNGTHN